MAITITEKVIWTVCPHGLTTEGKLSFSLHVSPRLTASGPGAHLSDSASWVDWPTLVRGCEFGLQAWLPTGQPGALVKAKDADMPVKPERAVYAALLGPTTPVVDYAFKDLKDKMILSYPVAQLARQISGLYGQLAISAQEDMPKAGQLIGLGWPYNKQDLKQRVGEVHRTPRADVLKLVHDHGAEGVAQMSDELLLDLFSQYHQPLQAPERHSHVHDPAKPDSNENAEWDGFKSAGGVPTKAALVAKTDFHRIAAALGNYPDLAQYCGLILNFELPNIFPADQVRFRAWVRRKGKLAPDPVIDVCPVTVCDKRFQAQGDANTREGFVLLKKSDYELIQMDVDGAASKVISVAVSLPRMKASEVNDDAFSDDVPQPDATAASLRTAGVMLAKAKRHVDVETRAKRAFALNKGVAMPVVGAPPVAQDLAAADLLRGYRIDIKDMNRPEHTWRSLHQRTVTYTLLKAPDASLSRLAELGIKKGSKGVTGSTKVMEGQVGTALISTADTGLPDDVYKLHEGLFVWRGWSLSAPEPFKALRNKPSPPDAPTEEQQHEAMVGENVGETPDGLPLMTEFAVTKGSLPALRFGHTYTARVRTVDLTGVSQPLIAEADDMCVSDPVTYRRYEAVESPVLMLATRPGTVAAEQYHPEDVECPLQGESMGRLAIRTYVDKPERSSKAVRRRIAPPRVTQRFAETHGVLDNSNRQLRQDVYKMLVEQDNGFGLVEVPASDYLNADPASVGDFKGKATQYTAAEEKYALPYLPDPHALAICARLRGLGDKTWKDVYIPLYDTWNDRFAKDWPHSQSVMIEGSEACLATGFRFNKATRTLEVPMPKACRQKVRLSSCIVPAQLFDPTRSVELLKFGLGALDNFALWALMQQMVAGQKMSLDRIRNLILAAQHWMFTPWREIELIHATQKPLVVPDFLTTLKVSQRPLRGLDAQLQFTTPLSGPSTVRLDLDAVWSEPDDNSVEIAAKSHPVVRGHREHVKQLPIARIDGFFGPFVPPVQEHHFHDTRYRRVIYSLTAASRFKEFFEKSLRDNDAATSVTSGDAVRWIKNSAPPPAPGVLYAIPTFGWLRSSAGAKASRRTAGLRVYLDRPWMTTGYNEMLAVVLPDTGSVYDSGDGAPNMPWVTQWGRDPLRISADITGNSPKPSAFRLARTKGPIRTPGTDFPPEEGSSLIDEAFKLNGLSVPGLSGTYAIAPHEVGFDKERQLWYADVVVAMPRGSYFPFVRLSVARYQPTSVDGAHMSPAVTCDFMQLSPDRIAVVLPVAGAAGRYAFFLYGDEPAQNAGDYAAKLGDISLRVQLHSGPPADSTLGWSDVGVLQKRSQGGTLNPSLEEGDAKTAAAKLFGTPVAGSAGAVFGKAGQRLQIESAVPAVTAQAGRVELGVSLPKLLWHTNFTAPAVPDGGKRRILITETELYPNEILDHEQPPSLLGRIVYAEGLEF